MSDPEWIAYAGAITGIIGAVTGIAGAIMGYISYRRTEDLKKLDLRLELRRAEADLQAVVNELPSLIEYAKKSRERVAAATGHYQSGAMQKWSKMWEDDMALAKAMAEKLPNLNTDYSSLDDATLEERLIAAHKQISSARQIKYKYDLEISADDKERDRIKDRH